MAAWRLVTDLSEEAINAGDTVPRAVIWSVVGSGVLGMIALIGFTVAIPDLKAVEAPGLPLLTILALPSPFHGSDKVIGAGAVLAALWYFLALRRRLRSGIAGPTPIERVAGGGGPGT